ncbi:MAG: hypothetical protein ACJ8IK_16370 [Burkholderiaceae bacterium]|jgi:hypothetical protein
MPIDRTAAAEISALLEQATMLCHESLRAIKSHEALGVVQVYGRLVGRFMGHSYTNLLGPLWAEHPDLEPAAMKQEWREPEPTLSAESQAALKAFVDQATLAMVRVRQVLAFQGIEGASLPYGGLAEVEDSVTAIHGFLDKPRFSDDQA